MPIRTTSVPSAAQLPAHTPVSAVIDIPAGERLPTRFDPANTRLPVLTFWRLSFVDPDGHSHDGVTLCAYRTTDGQGQPCLAWTYCGAAIDDTHTNGVDGWYRGAYPAPRAAKLTRFTPNGRGDCDAPVRLWDSQPYHRSCAAVRYAEGRGPLTTPMRGAADFRYAEPAYPREWAVLRQEFRALGSAVSDVVRSIRKGRRWYETLVPLEQLVDQINAPRGSALEYLPNLRGLQIKVVDTINSAVAADPHHRQVENTLGILDCGHVARVSEGVRLGNGLHYCQNCADTETETAVEDGGLYVRHDLYYWDRDDRWHLQPEPRVELSSWRETTAYLDHDRSFVSSAHGDFTMGIELEVETQDEDERHDALTQADDYFNASKQYAMFKADGSLDSERGFEIVTAARRMIDHIKAFGGWKPHHDLRSWATGGSCGMHVHIDSRAFTALTLGKFLQFYNLKANAAFIREIAGRHPHMDSQAADYAASLDQASLESPAKSLKSYNGSRYRMVNLTNLSYSEMGRLKADNVCRECKGDYSTVEVRIYRGTLKKARLLAQIEFTHAAVLYCRTASYAQLNRTDFLHWLGGFTGMYPNLARFFGLTVVRPRPNTRPVSTAEV